MGWPGCMRKGCDNWPSVGYTGVCSECIKDPDHVAAAAAAMNSNSAPFTANDLSNSCRLAWLGREPEGANLKMVLEVIRLDPGVKLEDAIDRARAHYWNTKQRSSS